MADPRASHADFLRSLSVLYVEDDAEVRGQLARFLERRVKRLVVAENGRLGLEAFLADHHDIVITDIKMPEMDGLQMAEHIKAASRDIPIIVITAYSDRDYLLRAIELGVDRYVTKPIDPDALMDAIFRAGEVHYQQQEIDRANRRVRDTLEQTVMAMARAIELRDPYTDGHQKRAAGRGHRHRPGPAAGKHRRHPPGRPGARRRQDPGADRNPQQTRRPARRGAQHRAPARQGWR